MKGKEIQSKPKVTEERKDEEKLKKLCEEGVWVSSEKKKNSKDFAIGYFCLKYFEAGKHIDSHTGKATDIKDAYLSWKIQRGNSRRFIHGWKFDPFPLKETIPYLLENMRYEDED